LAGKLILISKLVGILMGENKVKVVLDLLKLKLKLKKAEN
jgi:hypothetical protein